MPESPFQCQGVGDRVRVRQVPRHVSVQRGDGRESLVVCDHRRASPLLTQGNRAVQRFCYNTYTEGKSRDGGRASYLNLGIFLKREDCCRHKVPSYSEL